MWLTGQIVEFHPESHTYTATAGRRVFQGIARLLDHPGDVVGLAPGTLVAIHNQLGEWVIAGVLNQSAFGQTELSKVRVTELSDDGANDPTVDAPSLGDARARNAPSDIGSNSWARTGDVGQLLALLAGGTTILKASPLAQIRAHAQNDTVEIISNLFRHITAMGESAVTSDNGKLTYTWRGGSHVNDCGPEAENWTIRLDVGATPTGDIFCFTITTPAGQVLSRIAMTPAGDLEIRGTSFDVTAGATTETFTDDKSETVEGASTLEIVGDQTVTVEGQRTLEVSNDSSVLVGGNQNETVSGQKNAVTTGNVRRKIVGGLVPAPGSKAEIVEYTNGSVEVILGNPVTGALPAAQQGAQWTSYVGGFNFVLQPTSLPAPLGGFNVVSAQPASVNLGCDGVAVYDPTTGGHKTVLAPAPFGAMKYEPFLVMMQQLLSLLDAHVHPTAVGPSGPPLPMTPAVTPNLAPIRSVRVGLGL